LFSLTTCDACINLGQDVVLSTERFISSSPHYCATVVFHIPSRYPRLPHPVANVSSVLGEQAPKPMSPRVSAWARGVSGFWEALSRLLAGRLLSTLSVRRSLLLLLHSRRQPHYKDVYLLSVVWSHIISVASTRSRKIDSNRSASFGLYICDTCC